jgi:hypothetical protein
MLIRSRKMTQTMELRKRQESIMADFQLKMFQATVLCILLAIGNSPSFGYVGVIEVNPSRPHLESGDDFDLDVWLYPGESGEITFSSAEFNLLWDYPSFAPRPGTAPTLGSWTANHDAFGFSFAEFVGPDKAHLSITPWRNISVDNSALLLATLPMRAGPNPLEGSFLVDFFMEEQYGESSLWLQRSPIDQSQVLTRSQGFTAVPLPHAAWLMASGLLGLAAVRKKRHRR